MRPNDDGRDGVAVYHLKVGFGSRAGGQSARAKNEYIEREGRYAADGEEREHVEHGHMPAWAQDDPHAYWQAADAHERANGRLYSEVQFALPSELDASGRRALAGAFAERVCGGERLPYTLALHKGAAETPDKPDNPHAHLMFSERGNDGIARTAEQWFKRYNAKEPEQGGARDGAQWPGRARVRTDGARRVHHGSHAGRELENRPHGRSLLGRRDRRTRGRPKVSVGRGLLEAEARRMTDTQRPWDRLTTESDPAYEAFAAHLETGSLRDAYRQRKGNVPAGRVDRMEHHTPLGEPPRRLCRVDRPRVPGRHSGYLDHCMETDQ